MLRDICDIYFHVLLINKHPRENIMKTVDDESSQSQLDKRTFKKFSHTCIIYSTGPSIGCSGGWKVNK